MTGRRGGAIPLETDLVRMPVPLTAAYAVPPGTGIVFVSGLTAKDGESRTVAPGDAERQAEHIFDAIDDILRRAGGGLEDVVKLTVYLQSRADAAAVGRVRARRFSAGPPPASTMIVAALMSDDQLVEIEAIAAVSA
jgi:enamine deaminase RidA (YjgF/YER057c/UK114 family)